jgi:hypothetical protein
MKKHKEHKNQYAVQACYKTILADLRSQFPEDELVQAGLQDGRKLITKYRSLKDAYNRCVLL